MYWCNLFYHLTAIKYLWLFVDLTNSVIICNVKYKNDYLLLKLRIETMIILIIFL